MRARFRSARSAALRVERAVNLAEVIAGLRVAGAEFEDVEARRAARGVQESLASTLAAFANAGGGVVILGLDEQQGFAAAGVPDAGRSEEHTSELQSLR